jgi:hypothetical protein
MSDSESRSFGSILRKFAPTITLAVFLVPTTACSDPFLILHNDGTPFPTYETTRLQTSKSAVTFGLNDNGDLMIRHNDLSLIVAYNPSDTATDHQERIRIAQKQDIPAINGISLKVSLLF